jgi:hypothetical protein
MSFSWLNYETDDDDDVKITNNPIRKIKKKIRRKEERYKKNPSPELENELLELKEKLSMYGETKTKPIKKSKKKKFKKKKVDKAQKAKEKKWKREKELEKKRERERQQQKEWNKKKEEERKRRQVNRDNRIENNKLNKILLKYSKISINNIPMDIINWIKDTTKKGYYNLVKKYHPDKNKDVCIEYIKFINEWWNQTKKVSFVSCK